ncbi:hypothetical protein [Marinobacterium rhizophilum]|uniref:hypothetical protein n=1 Tax=Marinobacterium rhizophilum TaxID=420402 RepID=UPI00037358E3|nr:hypothetical protein [Marinobacterium rhizophilum]
MTQFNLTIDFSPPDLARIKRAGQIICIAKEAVGGRAQDAWITEQPRRSWPVQSSPLKIGRNFVKSLGFQGIGLTVGQ